MHATLSTQESLYYVVDIYTMKIRSTKLVHI